MCTRACLRVCVRACVSEWKKRIIKDIHYETFLLNESVLLIEYIGNEFMVIGNNHLHFTLIFGVDSMFN